MAGEWILAYLGYCNSIVPDIKPWWRESNAEVWWEAGFTRRPDYEIVYKRFRELDERGATDELFEAGAKLLRLAHVCSGGLIGLDLIFDFTEAEAHASIKHDCRDGECPGFPRRFRARRLGNARFAHAATQLVREDRQERSQTLLEEEDAPNIGDADELAYDSRRDILRVKVGGHWYRLSDKTAGVRAYTGPRRGAKFWIGNYNGKASCRCAGQAVTMVVRSASMQEYNIYPLLVERIHRILGGFRSARGDMGLGINKVYLQNSERGIFSVIPPKGRPGEPEPGDRERVDRHGIERCENCGGPTKRISFASEPKPRVFFECSLKPFAECHGKQSMLCEQEPKYLLPLRQDTQLYQALETKTFQYERAHWMARQRNGCGADSATTRPKRKGVGWQQLRADATVVLDWLKSCYRQGWLPIPNAAEHNHKEPVAVSGEAALDGLNERRLALNLHRPYGYRARRHGLGPVRLPQPEGVTLAAPDINDPAPTDGQRQARGGRPRQLTHLPEELPDLPLWAEQAESAAEDAGVNAQTDVPNAADGEEEASAVPPPRPPTVEVRRQQRAQARWASRDRAAGVPHSERHSTSSGPGPPSGQDRAPPDD